MAAANDESNDSASDVSDALIDQLSETFLQMHIQHDEELMLQYQMLAFVYNKKYLKVVHLSWVWQEFLTVHPEVPFTDMELKLEFCLRVLGNVDKFEYLSPVQNMYFKSRFFNQNADDLLKKCDLEPGLDFVTDTEGGATVMPFDVQNYLAAESINLYGNARMGPIPLRKSSNASGNKDRSLSQLLSLVFTTPVERQAGVRLTQDDVQARIKDGVRRKIDFNAFLQEHFDSISKPETPDQTTEQNIETPDAPSEMQPISTGPAFNNAITSTPLTSQVRRSLSQPITAKTSRQEPRRATSADRSGEPLASFADRMKARTKPRTKPKNLRM